MHTAQGVVIPKHFRIMHFYLCSDNHCWKVGFRCRHSQIVSLAEIRLGDKAATDPRSQLEFFYKSFAGKSPHFAIAGKYPGLRVTMKQVIYPILVIGTCIFFCKLDWLAGNSKKAQLAGMSATAEDLPPMTMYKSQ